MAAKRGSNSTYPARSSAVLRKAGIRLIRDIRLNLKSGPVVLGVLLGAFIVLGVLCKSVYLVSRGPRSSISSLLDAQPEALANKPANAVCACGGTNRIRKFARILDGADVVARVTFSEGREARILILFKGPPRLIEYGLALDPSTTFACLEGSDGVVASDGIDATSAQGAGGRAYTRRGGAAWELKYNELVDDAGYGDRIDRSFLVAGSFAQQDGLHKTNATVLSPLSDCNVVWAMRWALLGPDVREAIATNPADGDPWWRENYPWPPTENEWWAADFSSNQSSLVQQSDHHLGESRTRQNDGALSGIHPGSVSIVAACMDRRETLAIALRSWLEVEGITEIVLLDWSSSPPLDSSLAQEALRDRRLYLAQAPGQHTWSLTRAYNAAIRLATSAYILKVDCDTKLSRDFLKRHPISDKEFYAGDWRVLMQPSPNTGTSTDEVVGSGGKFVSDNLVHVNGLLYVSRSDFFSVGGYDERISTYGWDDTDIASRVAKLSESLRFNYSLVEHIPHANILRTTAQQSSSLLPAENPLAPAVEIQRNRILLTRFGLPPWTPSSLRLQWNVVKDKPEKRQAVASFLYSANTLPSVYELVSDKDAVDVSKRAIRLILLRYGIPLLPKTLSFEFYKLLATQVGHPERCAEVLLTIHGGCVSRLISLAATHAVTLGTEATAISQVTKAISEPVTALSRTHLESTQTISPPWPYAGWRTRIFWKQPDVGCTCRFTNVLNLQDLEVLAAPPLQQSPGDVPALVQQRPAAAGIGAQSGSFSDIRTLLASASKSGHGRASGLRLFKGDVICDVDPTSLSREHIKAVRGGLRNILPTKATKAAVVSSLRSSTPTVLDDPALDILQAKEKLGLSEFETVSDLYNEPEVHGMVASWGASSSASSHIVHHLGRRAKALYTALLLHSYEDLNGTGEHQDHISQLVRKVHDTFAGCPASPQGYIKAYPELAVILAGLLSANVCVAGVRDSGHSGR